MASRQHGEIPSQTITRVRVLVTGASGFTGRHIMPALVANNHDVVAASRQRTDFQEAVWRSAPDLGPGADWSDALHGIDAVVHLAGMAHVTGAAAASEKSFRRVNTEGTRQLARQCARAGVKHFVFAGSCHAVTAESDEMLTLSTVPRPCSAYGRSKLWAEGALKDELQDTGCAWTILRLPLVYGPGNKANFARLAGMVQLGIPLPLAGVNNRRSFLGVSNLADFIARCCLGSPASHHRTYYPADGKDLSTAELVMLLAEASGTSARLFKLPSGCLKRLGRLPGFRSLRKLTSSLYVDSSSARHELAWEPPHSTSRLLAGCFRVPS